MSDLSDLDLPPILAEIAEVAGLRAALTLAHARAGNEVYIPTPERLHDGHWLVEIVGIEAASAIAERFGSNDIAIPLAANGARGKAWRIIRRSLGEGKTVAEAARLAGVCDRTVRRHKNGHSGIDQEDSRQGKMF